MKKLIAILTLALIVCACSKMPTFEEQLEELGYSSEDITLIQSLSEEHQALFSDAYKEDLLSFVKDGLFREEKLEEYLKFDGLFEKGRMMKLVNDGILTMENAGKLSRLYQSDHFAEKNESLYLQYMDEYSDLDEMMEMVNSLRYKELYTDIRPVDMSKGDLILVNKYFSLMENYYPDDLVDVDPSLGKGQLSKKTYDAFLDLHEAAYRQGYNLRVVSAFRSYSYQDGLYNKYLKVDPKEVVDTYSARPGHSEHQTGMAIDVSLPGVSLDDFWKTDAAKWLNENCAHYGFIIRYPAEKIDITGYMEEPWHIRYLGQEVAEDVVRHGMTYDEYYAVFIDQ